MSNPPMDPDRLAELLGQAVGDLEPHADGMARITAGITRRRRVRQAGLAVATVVAVAVVSLAGASLRSSATPSIVVAHPTDTASSAASVPPSPRPPAPVAVPTGFRAESVSAINASTWWVGGDVPCGDGAACPALISTADAGVTFQRVPLPDLGASKGDSPLTVRFASVRDGWAYGLTVDAGPYLLSTHDGGQTWRRAPASIGGGVQRLEASGGQVYVLAGQPAKPTASGLIVSPITHDAWVQVPLPHPENGYRADFAVHGASIWIEGAAEGSTAATPRRALYRSLDGAATFTELVDPCAPELGGKFDARSPNVLWAFCATGSQGHPYVSLDGGATFAPVKAQQYWVNNTAVAALSRDRAILYGLTLDLTRDGGQSFSTVIASMSPQSSRPPIQSFVGFTDQLHGFAILGTGELLRSDDGGESFHPVAIR